MTRTPPIRRPGLTLVELLVVIALVIVLAALTVVITESAAFNSQKVTSAYDRVSGWLEIAQAQARRDGLPRGVRFLLNPVKDPALNPTGDPNYYASTEAQYIEVAEPWVPNPNADPNGPRIAFVYYTANGVSPPDPVPGLQAGTVPNTSTFRMVYFTTDPSRPQDLNEFDQRVVVGDYIIFPSPIMKRVCQIIAINNTTANVTIGGTTCPARLLILRDTAYPDLGVNNSGPFPGTVPPAPPACRIEYQFGFQSGPRPLIGEPTLQLTGGTVIDCRIVPGTNPVALDTPTTTSNVSPVYDSLLQKYYFDVLFSPNGSVMQATGSPICLWVRNPEKTPHPRLDVTLGKPAGVDLRPQYDAAGEQVLVTINPQNGLVRPFPPAPPTPGATPYDFAREGIISGP